MPQYYHYNNYCVKLGHMYCTLLYIYKTSTLALVDPGHSCVKANFDDCQCPLFLPAEDTLNLFHEQFLKYVDAKAVVGELKHNGIVPQSCQEKVARADGYRQRSEILHDCLKRTCNREALIKACDIIIALAEKGGEESNPNMKEVGEDMMKELGTGKTFVHCYVSLIFTYTHNYNDILLHSFQSMDMLFLWI